MTFGERLLLLRRKAGLTQQRLGVLADLNTNTVSRLERGDIPDPSGSVVLRLARALHTTTDYLLSGEGAVADTPAPPKRARRRQPRAADNDTEEPAA